MPKVLPQPAANDSRRRGRRVSTSLSEINVIPLVDVMLVLLIIFMVAAPMLQKGIDVKLPVTSRPQKMTDERLYVTVPLTFRQDRRVFLDEEGVGITVLAERIRQALTANGERDVYLRGDGGVQLQELMEVISELKEGGVQNVGIVAQQEARK